MNRKRWPQIITKEYTLLLTYSNNLVLLGYLLHSRAVFGIRNTVLLESLLNLIPCELRYIRHYCIIANQKRTYPTSGRYPRWVIATLEDTIALVSKVTQGINQMAEAYPKRNWDLIEALTKLIYQDILEIERLIQSGSPPKPSPNQPNKPNNKSGGSL